MSDFSTEGINNPQLKEYLCKYVEKIFNENQFFVKVFGKKYIEKKLKTELLNVYTNGIGSNVGTRGFYDVGKKEVTICESGKDGKPLNIQDIINDKDLQAVLVHEFVHAFLNRDKKECRKLHIVNGTGLLEIYDDKEIGRGLNEGYDQWLCQKVDLYSPSYEELTKILYLIEAGIGTEKTMELGKGNIKYRFPKLLNMSGKEVYNLLSYSDEINRLNRRIITYSYMENQLFDKMMFDTKESNESQEYEYTEKAKEYIEEVKKDSDYLSYLESNGLDDTEKNTLDYVINCLKDMNDQKSLAILNCESMILDKYFTKDFQEIFDNNEISKENYIKCMKVISLLNSKKINLDEIDGLDSKEAYSEFSSVKLHRDFEVSADKFMENYLKEKVNEYNQGTLKLQSFMKEINEIHVSKRFFEEFAKNINPEFSDDLGGLLFCISNYSNNEEFINKVLNTSLLKLSSEDKSLNIETSLILSDKVFYNSLNQLNTVVRTSNEKVEFDFTIPLDDDGEYIRTMKNFDNLRKEVFSKNPNSKIYIVSRDIAVDDGKKCSFYHIEGGEMVPMVLTNKLDFKFLPEEKSQEEQNLLPVKVSKISMFFNNLRKKWNDFRNRNVEPNPVYSEDFKINSSKEKEDKIASYRVDDFNDKLKKRAKDENLNEKDSNDKENDGR